MNKALELVRRIFIVALLEEKPRNLTEKEFLDLMFRVKQRQICAYRALKSFGLPGVFLEGGVHPVEGVTKGRTICREQLIWARKDDTQPYFDVEFDGSVFRMNAREWNSIQSVLRKAQGNDPIA